MITKKAIGAAIRDARTAAGLTQVELAERMGRKQVEIARWEAGRYTPLVDTFYSLCIAVGADPGSILTEAAAQTAQEKQ
ncbi:MAG: helix-turn-helix transcriptional regulator [Bacillota bacterium]|nr:helix-turn-helix transcriptional regulator [Bacillota bacterium]